MIEVRLGSFLVALRFPVVEHLLADASDVVKHALLGIIARCVAPAQSAPTRPS